MCNFVLFCSQLGSIADRTISEADSDGDKHISFEEFAAVSDIVKQEIFIPSF